MADREVTKSGKDSDGDITALCNEAAAWSPRAKRDVIDDIESGSHTYYVQHPGTQRSDIHVVDGPNGKYLRTSRDSDPENNLSILQDC